MLFARTKPQVPLQILGQKVLKKDMEIVIYLGRFNLIENESASEIYFVCGLVTKTFIYTSFEQKKMGNLTQV